jgi:hypothetical protein
MTLSVPLFRALVVCASKFDWIEEPATSSNVANDLVSHGKKENSKPRPSRSGRIGQPEGQRPGRCKSESLMDDVHECYYSAAKKCN